MIAINNPALRLAATVIVFVYVSLLQGARSIARSMIYIIPLLLLISILNPLFNHIGQTVLLYINDEPISLEAVLYGLFAAILIISLVQFFTAFSICIDAHRLKFLLGRALPALSLMISMILRYMPHLRRRLKEILGVQQTLGLETTSGPWRKRFSNGANVLLGLMSLSMEEGIDTSDSMNARGYYLRGKTHFHSYVYKNTDIICIIIVLILDAALVVPLAMGFSDYNFYPLLTPFLKNGISVFMLIIYAILAALPIIVNILEEIRWKIIKSRI